MGPRRRQTEEVIVRQVHGRSDVDVYPTELMKGHARYDVIKGKLVPLQIVVCETRGPCLNQLQADERMVGTTLLNSSQI